MKTEDILTFMVFTLSQRIQKTTHVTLTHIRGITAIIASIPSQSKAKVSENSSL